MSSNIYFNEILYQIYPLGFCGSLNGSDNKHSILKVLDWMDHFKKLGVTTILFNPLFESVHHGYDTIDFYNVDKRLGTNKDLQKVIKALHKNGFKVMFDGVFNHVGRDFPLFKDVLEKREASEYKDFFYIDFNNSNNEDSFWYSDWEGHHELVKLNLENYRVREYLFDAVDKWISDYEIDALRLDVAYTINRDFMRELVNHIRSIKNDFFFVGEMVNGDYNVLFNEASLDSVTNYECRKGLYSSFNSHNLFEIAYSLNRQFGNDNWTLYRGKKLLSFLDNHDVDRIASILEDERDLPLIYSLLYAMPGIPCIYYGSEWKQKGKRTNTSDIELRPCFEEPIWNDLCDVISELSKIRKKYSVLYDGDYTQLYIQNEQYVFKRENDEGILLYFLNISDNTVDIHLDIDLSNYKNLLNKKANESFNQLAPKTFKLLYLKK